MLVQLNKFQGSFEIKDNNNKSVVLEFFNSTIYGGNCYFHVRTILDQRNSDKVFFLQDNFFKMCQDLVDKHYWKVGATLDVLRILIMTYSIL